MAIPSRWYLDRGSFVTHLLRRQIVGYGTVVFAAFLFLLGLIFPDFYNGLSLVDEKMVLRAGNPKTKEAKVEEFKEVFGPKDDEDLNEEELS